MKSSFYFEPDKQELLEKYVTILKHYQKKFNLIGNSTISNLWQRHIVDSAQVFALLPKEKKNCYLIDVGTGAGLPGLVLAIMGRKDVFLCEKSKKKAFFLIEAKHACGVRASIINERIENVKLSNCSIIVSRAFSSLNKLLISTMHLMTKDTIFFVHKGKKYKDEVEEAKKNFTFAVDYYESVTSYEGKIVRVKNIRKKANEFD